MLRYVTICIYHTLYYAKHLLNYFVAHFIRSRHWNIVWQFNQNTQENSFRIQSFSKIRFPWFVIQIPPVYLLFLHFLGLVSFFAFLSLQIIFNHWHSEIKDCQSLHLYFNIIILEITTPMIWNNCKCTATFNRNCCTENCKCFNVLHEKHLNTDNLDVRNNLKPNPNQLYLQWTQLNAMLPYSV